MPEVPYRLCDSQTHGRQVPRSVKYYQTHRDSKRKHFTSLCQFKIRKIIMCFFFLSFFLSSSFLNPILNLSFWTRKLFIFKGCFPKEKKKRFPVNHDQHDHDNSQDHRDLEQSGYLSASAGTGTPVMQYFKVSCQTAQQELQEF